MRIYIKLLTARVKLVLLVVNSVKLHLTAFIGKQTASACADHSSLNLNDQKTRCLKAVSVGCVVTLFVKTRHKR